MRFDYVPYSGNWLPLVPVAFSHQHAALPAVGALVDTGATHTILPLEMASALGITIELEDRIETQVAGGGQCFLYPSPVTLAYHLQDASNRQSCQWRGQVFFALGQQFVLLGHHQCLEKFHLTFQGPERVLELQPRFGTKPQY